MLDEGTIRAHWQAHMAAGWTPNCRACHTAIGPNPWHLVWYPKCDGDTGWWPAHIYCQPNRLDPGPPA